MSFELEFLQKEIYLLKLEDGREVEVHLAVLDENSMWTKSEISEEMLIGLLKDEATHTLLKKAEKLLSYRAYSRKELFDKLYKYEQDAEIRNRVLDRFEDYGLINDEKYAVRCAEYFINIKHLSKRETQNRMSFLRGLSKEDIENSICEYEDSDIENLSYLIDKKYYKYFGDMEDKKEVSKGKNALARLGFNFGDIDNAIEDYIYQSED